MRTRTVTAPPKIPYQWIVKPACRLLLLALLHCEVPIVGSLVFCSLGGFTTDELDSGDWLRNLSFGIVWRFPQRWCEDLREAARLSRPSPVPPEGRVFRT